MHFSQLSFTKYILLCYLVTLRLSLPSFLPSPSPLCSYHILSGICKESYLIAPPSPDLTFFSVALNNHFRVGLGDKNRVVEWLWKLDA